MKELSKPLTDILLCPFTKKKLQLLEDDAILRINEKITQGQFFHYSGIPFKKHLTQAYTSANSLYIYPVIDDVILLKRELAIVPKNRVENPFLKVSESAIQSFENKFNFDSEVETADQKNVGHALKEFVDRAKERIDRSGSVLVTANASNSEEVLNLSYGLNYSNHIHADFDLSRVRQVKQDLPESTICILVDREGMAFKSETIDSYCDFDSVDSLTKLGQSEYYQELKRVLKEEGVSVAAYFDLRNLTLKKLLNKDIRSQKALKVLSPWKKVKLPKLYFFGVDANSTETQDELTVKKAKFSNQLN